MKDWNALDRFIGYLRYGKVNKYVKENAVVVDVGCGREGAFLLKHSAKIKKGIGFDFRIENSKKGNVELINNKGMERYPIEDDTVDVIFMNAVLEHLTDPCAVLLECKRILKKRGCLVMTTPTRMSKPILELLAYKLHVINEEEIREHQHYYNKKDIVKLCKKVRMSMVRYSYFELGMNSIIVLGKGKM